MFGGINMKIVKYLIKYCLNFVLLGLVFFSSILYTFGVDDFEFSYRQICIILVAFKGNTKIALICYFITIINQMLLIFIIADSVLNGKSVFSLIIGFAYLMIINCFTAFELLESRRGENEITN